MKVYVENDNKLIQEMFHNRGWEIVDDYKSCDLICFSGGSDVSPILYEEEKDPRTSCNYERDLSCLKIAIYETTSKKPVIPMVGICRGAQFLHVLMGGKLHQHVEGHGLYGTHDAVTWDGRTVEVTSTHHQQMKDTSEYGDEVLVAADGGLEAVLYIDDSVLCYQPHPEYTKKDHECQELFFELLKEII